MVETGVGVALDGVALGGRAVLERRDGALGKVDQVGRGRLVGLGGFSAFAGFSALAGLVGLGGLVGLLRRLVGLGVDGDLETGEGLVGGLGEQDVVGAQHVVGVELVDGQDVDVGQVAHRLHRHEVGAVEHDEHVLAVGQTREQRGRGLGRGGVAGGDRLDDVDAVVTGPVGEGTAQGGGLHLLGGPLGVVTRLRAVDDATAGELRGAGRTLTGAAGALLLVGLATATADLGPGLRRVRALTGGRELADDDLVDQRDVGLHVEDLGGELDLESGD